jgi:hypothetical protein
MHDVDRIKGKEAGNKGLQLIIVSYSKLKKGRTHAAVDLQHRADEIC